MSLVLITGSAGWMGHYLTRGLSTPDRRLRLLDNVVSQGPGLPTSAEVIQASIEDFDSVRSASDGVDAVVHLAGIPKEAPFHEIVQVNVQGTYNILESARLNGVRRVVLASSNHVAGFQRKSPDTVLGDEVAARPDTYYGWGKAASESLADLYADRFGMSIVSVRIGQFAEQCTPDLRGLGIWFSPGDAVGLFEAALNAPVEGHVRVWGVSANSRSWLSLDGGLALGYRARDDSEQFAAALPDAPSESEDRLGGAFCDEPLGERMPPPPRPSAI